MKEFSLEVMGEWGEGSNYRFGERSIMEGFIKEMLFDWRSDGE